MVWRLAVRGVIADRNRSLFLILSLALSSLVLVVGGSVVSSFRSNIENGLRRGFSGDLQVFDGTNPPVQLTAEVPVDFVPIRDAQAASKVLLADRDVRAVTPRATVSGLILAGPRSAPAVLVGIDPDAEPETLARLRAGSGRDGLNGVLLGRPMAERLKPADANGEVTLLIPTEDGLFEGDVLVVDGVYSPPGLPLIDEFIAFVPFRHLQSLLGNEGYPGGLVVWLEDGTDVLAAQRRLGQALHDAGLPLEVWTWRQLSGDLMGVVEIGRRLIGTGYLFVLLVIAVGVGNMLLILMFERTREIGLMRALGTPRWGIIRILLAEVALVSAISSALGVLAGGILCGWLGRVGIPAVSRAMVYAFGGERFFPSIQAGELLVGFLVVALVGPLAALWPAIRASAADPANVMRAPG